MRKGISSKLTEKQASQLSKLASMPDDEIDTSDIPEVLDWSGAKRGLLYRPTKQQITLRLDADVLAWFRAAVPGGLGYQTRSTAFCANMPGASQVDDVRLDLDQSWRPTRPTTFRPKLERPTFRWTRAGNGLHGEAPTTKAGTAPGGKGADHATSVATPCICQTIPAVAAADSRRSGCPPTHRNGWCQQDLSRPCFESSVRWAPVAGEGGNAAGSSSPLRAYARLSRRSSTQFLLSPWRPRVRSTCFQCCSRATTAPSGVFPPTTSNRANLK